MKRFLRYFSIFEWSLWLGSITVILISFFLGGDTDILKLIASMVGVSALIFLAKGNVIGQFLIILFSLLYGIISLSYHYYGEMITYVFMSLPAAVVACITWLKNPSKKGNSEVAVAPMNKRKLLLLTLLTLAVTTAFYFLLAYFQTANLALSTLSVATSFFASALLICRSPYYALAYAANDIVLIGLWTLASFANLSYLPMVMCFIAFLLNDGYGFISWKRMERRQKE
jgi:nicotinamide mononucleotide transporter PnuC